MLAYCSRKEKHLKKLRAAGTVSEETAVKLEMLNLDGMELSILKRLVGKGIVRMTSDGQYYWSGKKDAKTEKTIE